MPGDGERFDAVDRAHRMKPGVPKRGNQHLDRLAVVVDDEDAGGTDSRVASARSFDGTRFPGIDGRGWKTDGERAAAARTIAPRVDRAAVPLDERPRKGEPEAESALAPVEAALTLERANSAGELAVHDGGLRVRRRNQAVLDRRPLVRDDAADQQSGND